MKTIERVSIVEQVINSLKGYIEEQHCKPGDKMPTEREVCEALGVGRSTVREAYRMMQMMNLVKSVQGRGVFVADGKEAGNDGENWFKEHGKSVMDYMEVRMAIEPIATRLAIQRAKTSDIRRLERIHSLFQEAVEVSDPIKMASYDEAFHNYITNITENRLLIKIQENITECCGEYRLRSFEDTEKNTHAPRLHRKIVEAFQAREAEKGEAVMTEHLKLALTDFEETMNGINEKTDKKIVQE